MAADLPDHPAAEVLEVSTPTQFKGLSHPFRQRLLFTLGQRPATVSQLARALASPKGSVAHHLQVLEAGGLVEVVGTRKVRGGTERYFQRTARRLSMDEHAAGPVSAMLAAVAEEVSSAPVEPLLTLRHVRLTAADAARLAATLAELVDDLADAGGDVARYGVLVGVFQQTSIEPGNDGPS
jgi:predicted ArsR family transcriptional regulator